MDEGEKRRLVEGMGFDPDEVGLLGIYDPTAPAAEKADTIASAVLGALGRVGEAEEAELRRFMRLVAEALEDEAPRGGEPAGVEGEETEGERCERLLPGWDTALHNSPHFREGDRVTGVRALADRVADIAGGTGVVVRVEVERADGSYAIFSAHHEPRPGEVTATFAGRDALLKLERMLEIAKRSEWEWKVEEE